MKAKECYLCGSTAFRRLARRTLLEKTLLFFAGYFPWECVICRRKVFFRDNGHSTASAG
jgi:hypothetical protein